MPCIIRRVLTDRYENHVKIAPGEWRLREQVEALEAWLLDNRQELDSTQEWVADIGFCIRKDAAGGGPPISKDLMRMCLQVNLEIYLSEYPGEA